MTMGISSAQHCLNTPRILVRIGFKLPEIVCRIIYIRMHFDIFRKTPGTNLLCPRAFTNSSLYSTTHLPRRSTVPLIHNTHEEARIIHTTQSASAVQGQRRPKEEVQKEGCRWGTKEEEDNS